MVRENGEMEMIPPDDDEPFPDHQLMLVGLGLGFHDERLRELLGQIITEKQAQADAKAKP